MKRFINLALLAFGLGAAAPALAADGPVLIPRPQKLEMKEGTFTLNAQTAIYIRTEELRPVAEYLRAALAPIFGANAPEIKRTPNPAPAPAPDNIILLSNRTPENLAPEGYALTISPKGINIRARSAEQIFYGVQTLLQLLPDAIESKTAPADAKWTVPCLNITDQPRFSHRALLLDCGRHFFSVDEVKRVIDLMARYKMNVLHWHLTEDQGWRIEIKKYPRLTEVGSSRMGENSKMYPDGKSKPAFYTQDQVREIVAYAASRFVKVVPEIEMPGHAQAALASYPELSCTGAPIEVSTHWGVHKDVYCAGNEKVLQFQKDVLTEVMDLFPSKEIHIGGDECPKDRWQACPKCQARIKAEGLKDEKELQSWFIRQITGFLSDHGRRAICWDEVLEEGLHEGIVVQEWRGHKPAPEGSAAKAAAFKMDVIVSPAPTWYLDMPMVKDKKGGKYTWGRPANLADAYALEPIPQGLAPELHKYILGGEGCVWTEHIAPVRFDYFTFPRVLAIAENLWSPAEGKAFAEFYGRVKAHYPRLERMGVNYGPAFAEDLKTRQDPGGEL